VLDANPALVRMLGCPSLAQLLGDRQLQLLPAGGAPPPEADAREPFTVELVRKDGGKAWAEVIAQAIRRQNGEVACFEGMVRNIDDRKRTEQALKESEEVLRQAQKMEAVGRLAGGVAHDFNNLLTAINGFGDLLLMQVAKDDPRRLHVEEIRKAGDRAAALTGQLLAFSRKQVLAPRRIDINGVVAGMEPMLRRLIGENIRFEVRLVPGLPEVLADASQAEQIILNLALNARDAMPTGGELRIVTGRRLLHGGRTRSLGDLPDGEYAELAVEDTGVGMDEETKARLFEPFFTTKEKDKGTGLGLSMVYGAVKQGNGAIEVETRKGRGTSFRVLLPAAADGEGARAPNRPTGKIPAAGKGTETILLVEDEDAVRRLVRDVLRFGGYTVLEAPGGGQALDVAGRHEGPIHLLLTDVVMGGMSGRELAERLRAARPDTRVLYMSGYTEDAIIRHGVQAAQTSFIGKPFSPAALAAKVREVLSASAEDAGRTASAEAAG
jgi:signal transduction histidine kinase/ActR/RegA family two-component response regulator